MLRRIASIVIRIIAAVFVVAVLAVLAAFIVVQSGWFHEFVRSRIISELERATGGRVELGRFSFRGATLTAQVAPLILHGKEPVGEMPLLRIESATLRLSVISGIEKKIELAFLRLENPQVRVVTYPDGSTNLPSPREHLDERNWAEQLIDLGVRRYELSNGQFQYDDRKASLSLQGEGLQVRMRYDAKTPAYETELDSNRMRVLPATAPPVEAGVSARFSIERSRIAVSELHLSTREARADLTGELRDLDRPKASFDVKATAPVRELVRLFSVPLQPTGSAAFDGRLEIAFGEPLTYALRGRVNARGLGYTQDRLKITDANARGQVQLSPEEAVISGIDATALGAHFVGSASVHNWSKVEAAGTIDGLTIAQAANFLTDEKMPWNGILAGDVSATATLGRKDAIAHVDLAIAPAGPNPITGRLNASLDQTTGALTLNSSYAATAATRLDVSGTLDKTIQVQFRSTDLNDVLPALALADPHTPQQQIPLKLVNGLATASGSVSGRLDNPQFQGQVSVSNGIVEGHAFDRFTATLNATKSIIAASRFTVARHMTDVTGNVTFAARNGSFDDAAVSGQATVRNADLQELAKEFGNSLDVSGIANGTARVTGFVQSPQAEIVVDVQNPAALGERLDRLHANLQITPDSVEVSAGDAQDGPGRLRFSGNYRHPADDWKSGDAQIQLNSQNLTATRIEALTRMAPRFDARLNADVRGRIHLSNGIFSLTSADGSASAQKITFDKQPLGDLSLNGNTSGGSATITAAGKVRDISVNGQGSWRLEGDEPGSANIQFSRATIDSLHKLAMLFGLAPSGDQNELPFEGFVEGHVALSLALLRPQDFRSEVTMDSMQIDPRPDQTLRLGVQAQDVTVRNTQPIVIDVNSREARIRSAKLVARNTDIEATGGVGFAAGAGADLGFQGSINLVVLQLLNPNLLATGNATLQAALRGSLSNPMLNGRMELKGASLYLSDFPTGVDNANGVVLFDRNRATIDKLTAQAGGGTVSLTGFVGFGQNLIYRLQADAKQIRVRYPEALSNTFSGQLALNGTSDANTLSGTLTIDRTVINPGADLGQLFASAAGPGTGMSDSGYLHGLQFNVRVESAPGFQFNTSLATDLQASIDLRLRGTLARPVLLGNISVNQGEIEVFGNKYSVDRGEIRFLNPVKLDPTLDLQLETKARGIPVTIGFTGTMEHLNVSYSSDPPMQQSEIIALLAVGRDPNSLGAISVPQSSTSGSGFQIAGGGVLSQALLDQQSNRFQRFFGASKVKIDPTITGVDYLPQARLTLEQQVSKDITFTYITNLNRTQEQIVRLEWNFDKNWSAVAIRDANGLFGVDFLYKKQFR